MDAEKILLSYPYGLAVFDHRLKTVFVNAALKEILKTSAASRVEDADQLFRKTPEVTGLVREFFTSGMGYLDHDYRLNSDWDETVPVVLSVAGINYGAKEAGAVVTVRPIGGKEEMDHELEKDEKMAMLSMMAAGLAHEIKNPLGGIRGTAQLIGQTNRELGEYCDVIVKETDRVSALVTELLNLRGERAPNWKTVNIHQPLDETIKLLEAVFKQKEITVRRDYDPSLPDIKAEPDRLKQVFINLCKNATEAMGKGGQLVIRTRTPLVPSASSRRGIRSSYISIEFEDNGQGIPPKVFKHLFTPFNTSKKIGTGLGLVLSLKIIRDHGGTLSLENRPGNVGAVAKALIPIRK